MDYIDRINAGEPGPSDPRYLPHVDNRRKTPGPINGNGWFRADFLPFLARLAVIALGIVICGILVGMFA